MKGDFSDDDLGLLLREKALERCEHEYHRDDVVPVIDDGFNTSYSYSHVPLLGVIPSERTNLYGLRRFHCESSEKTKD